MLRWLLLFFGLVVWTVHFFALYAIASIFLTTDLARWLTLAVTALCLAANAAAVPVALRCPAGDSQRGWETAVSLWGLLLASVAIFWQGLVGLFL